MEKRRPRRRACGRTGTEAGGPRACAPPNGTGWLTIVASCGPPRVSLINPGALNSRAAVGAAQSNGDGRAAWLGTNSVSKFTAISAPGHSHWFRDVRVGSAFPLSHRCADILDRQQCAHLRTFPITEVPRPTA